MIRFTVLLALILIIYVKCVKETLSEQDRIMKNIFKISDNQNVKQVGDEIYIIDNFYKNPEDIRKLAISNKNNFLNHTSLYLTRSINPYLYSNIMYELISKMESILWVDLNKNDWDNDIEINSNGFIQYLTEDGKPTIHYDNHWTLIIFLSPNPDENTGTSIYKHKATGVKKYMDDTEAKEIYGEDKFKEMINKYSKDNENINGMPQYDKWDKIYSCKNIYNSAILFNGRQWHSSNGGFGKDVENARLFQTFFFLEFKKN